MDTLISIFVTWQFVILTIGIAAMTMLFRTFIEYFWLDNPRLPGNSKSKIWREGVLTTFPIFMGILFAIFGKSFPYPEAINEPYSRFLFGSSAGLLSPTLYRVLKAFLWKNAGIDPSSPPFPPPVFPPVPPPTPVSPPPCDDSNPSLPSTDNNSSNNS